jgi:hypothetical protein
MKWMLWVSNGSGMVGQASIFHLTGVVLDCSFRISRRPTFRIKRFGSGKLKGASVSSISKEREKAEKALRLNGI